MLVVQSYGQYLAEGWVALEGSDGPAVAGEAAHHHLALRLGLPAAGQHRAAVRAHQVAGRDGGVVLQHAGSRSSSHQAATQRVLPQTITSKQ